MRLIDADAIEMELGVEDRDLYVQHVLDSAPTIKAYTIEDLRDAYRDGQDNECSYHWGIRKAEPRYMKDEVNNENHN